ncbi:hypothetical protein ACQRXC_26505 (plasmid) [Niallia taxi]
MLPFALHELKKRQRKLTAADIYSTIALGILNVTISMNLIQIAY